MPATVVLQAGVEQLSNVVADPISAVLLLVGLVFLGVSSLVVGGLALGAVVDLFVSEPDRGPPVQGQ